MMQDMSLDVNAIICASSEISATGNIRSIDGINVNCILIEISLKFVPEFV